MLRSPARALVAPLLAASILALGACDQPRWDDPVYVGQKLEDPDPAVRTLAVQRLLDRESPIDDQARAELIPQLTKLYVEGDPNQRAIMEYLVTTRDPRAAEAYLAEVKTNATKFAGSAAEALGDAEARSAVPAMVDLLEKTDDADIKEGILRGLVALADPASLPALVKVLELDADNNRISLHAYACDAIGEIARAHPDSITPEVVDAAVLGMFLANMKQQSVAKECGLAVQSIGEPAIARLLSVWKGEYEPVQKLMLAYKFPPNRPKGVAATRLSSMRAQAAVRPMIEDISREEIAAPPTQSGARKGPWLQMESQTLSEEMLGLGDIGAAAAIAPLTAVMSGERNEGWKAFMLDPRVQTQLRQDAALALNKIGDRSAVDAIAQIAKKLDANAELEKAAAILAERGGRPMGALERYSLNVMAARAWAMLAPPEAKADYLAWASGVEPAELKAELMKNVSAFDAAAECAAKGEAGAQAACYGEKLGDADERVREKAAYELSRLPGEAAAPVLAKYIGHDSLATREIVTFGLYRHPSKEALAAVEATLEAEKDRGGDAQKLDRRRLELLRAYLARKV